MTIFVPIQGTVIR